MTNVHTIFSKPSTSNKKITYPNSFENVNEKQKSIIKNIRESLIKKDPKIKEELKRRIKLRTGANYNTMADLVDELSSDQVLDKALLSHLATMVANFTEEIFFS